MDDYDQEVAHDMLEDDEILFEDKKKEIKESNKDEAKEVANN